MSDEKPISFTRAKAEKANDNREWTAIDALEHTIDEIKKGGINPERMLILYVDAKDVANSGYVSMNTNSSEAVLMLEKQKFYCMQDLMRGVEHDD